MKGTFATRSEIKELVEKVSREKLEEIVSRTKGYYEVGKDQDEKMAREMREEIERLLEDMKGSNDHDDEMEL